MTSRPVPMQWDGEVMRPTRGFAALADKQYIVGEVYTLAEAEPSRSGASHRHYFAAVYDAWLNLPEREAERFPTAEALRKYALIRAGFCNVSELVASSKAEAVRIAAFVSQADPYALVTVKGVVVQRFTAQSQDLRSMGRRVFQESKDAVLGVLAGMIEVPTEQLLFDGSRDAAGGGESLKPAADAA